MPSISTSERFGVEAVRCVPYLYDTRKELKQPNRNREARASSSVLKFPANYTSDGANYPLNNAEQLSRVLQEILSGAGGAAPSGPPREMVETAIRVLKNKGAPTTNLAKPKPTRAFRYHADTRIPGTCIAARSTTTTTPRDGR